MRILHLDAGKVMRGGQWQVMRLMEGLATTGVESTLLARAGAPLYEAARKKGWRVEGLGLTRAVLMARNHDLLHAHDARSHTMGTLVHGVPLVVSRRVAFPIGGAPGGLRVGSKWKYGRATHYLAVSEFVKSVLIAGGVAAEKITVVYDGVPVLEPAHASEPAIVLTPANADDPQKGTPVAAAAAQLAGVKLRLSENLGYDLSHATLFVYITHSEGLGSGVLLAMSAGVPVIASNVGGLPEVIQHRENGMLVENTPEAIAAAIRELLDHPALARQIGAAGRRTILERFTAAHMVSRTMEVYRQVLS